MVRGGRPVTLRVAELQLKPESPNNPKPRPLVPGPRVQGTLVLETESNTNNDNSNQNRNSNHQIQMIIAAYALLVRVIGS